MRASMGAIRKKRASNRSIPSTNPHCGYTLNPPVSSSAQLPVVPEFPASVRHRVRAGLELLPEFHDV